MNKPVYWGLSILEISKTITYEFWYYDIRPKYQCNAKLYYMDIDNFIICIKTEDVMKTLQMMLKKRFDTSNYEINGSLSKGKNEKLCILKEINKIALSRNDDKRLQTCDRIKSYPYGGNAGKVCKTELLENLNMKWLILMMLQIKEKKTKKAEHNPKWPYIPNYL